MDTPLYYKAHEKYSECFSESHPESFNEERLGGTNVNGDPGTYFHPNVWGYFFNTLNIKSIVDIGCGFGYAIDFIKKNFSNIEIIGIEGSPKVVSICLHPENIRQHDYNTGPYMLEKTFDLGWSTEFVEHVEEQYIPNFIATFKCCKYVAFSFGGPGQGGHHHVNCNTKEYWINKFKENNFEYLEKENIILNQLAEKDKNDLKTLYNIPEHHFYNIPRENLFKYNPDHHCYHFLERGLFFKNSGLV